MFSLNQFRYRRYALSILQCHPARFTRGSHEAVLFAESRDSSLSLLDWMRQCYDQKGKPLLVCSGYLRHIEPNALADFKDQRHYVSIHQPLLEAAMEFGLFTFTQAGVFPEIGKPTSEINTRYDPSDETPGLLILGKYLDDKPIEKTDLSSTPIDQDRYLHAFYLGMLMMRFVWFHEMAHCFNGHVRLAQSMRWTTRLYEVPSRIGFKRRAPVSQDTSARDAMRFFEIDADQLAVEMMIGTQLIDAEIHSAFQSLDRRLRLKFTLFAALSVTRCFDLFEQYNYRGLLEVSPADTHPTPACRLQHLLACATRVIEEKQPEASALIDETINEFSTLLIRIDNNASLLQIDTTDELAAIVAHRDAINSQLQHYRYYVPA